MDHLGRPQWEHIHCRNESQDSPVLPSTRCGTPALMLSPVPGQDTYHVGQSLLIWKTDKSQEWVAGFGKDLKHREGAQKAKPPSQSGTKCPVKIMWMQMWLDLTAAETSTQTDRLTT